MKVYLLWFNEWENSYVLGVFAEKQQADRWKQYFIKYPTDMDYACDMKYYSTRDDYVSRFNVEEIELGALNPNIKVDNLKYLEMQYDKNETH